MFTVFLSFKGQKDYRLKHDVGFKIGYISNNTHQLSIDTISFKLQWQSIINLPGVKLETIKIVDGITNGDVKQKYYMVIASDKSKNLKSARWLVREGDSLYLFKNNRLTVPNEVFYRTYFTVYGSDKNCYPQVALMGGNYFWGANKAMYCSPDDPCKSISTFFPNE